MKLTKSQKRELAYYEGLKLAYSKALWIVDEQLIQNDIRKFGRSIEADIMLNLIKHSIYPEYILATSKINEIKGEDK